eukprot:TRINITY_DN508_c1_g1_i1.p1 TRINITY_DN508_c1_g1~~TRINITY_DN508_c1_g1_i1.p1  ORF type:complete len:545 (-),score=115.19 TRINITY_DN508_c1_g1_i1:56-1690(-)
MKVLTVVLLVACVAFAAALRGSVSYDGNYHFKEGIDRLAVAYGEYVDEIQKDGWGKLHITTNAQYGDDIQLRAAGILEGYLTADRIYQHYTNLLPVFFPNGQMTASVKNWFEAQNTWIRSEIKNNAHSDPYWGQVSAIVSQFDGLMQGYNMFMSKNDTKKTLDVWAFTILNGAGDLLDITAAFSHEDNLGRPNLRPKEHKDWSYRDLKNWIYNSHCSGLVKTTGDLSDIWIGHTSWFMFQSTMRISKYYDFPLHNPSTRSKVVTFSSYPGFLESLDDFYITSSQLVVIETSNSIFNQSLYDIVKNNPRVLLSWQRTLLANRVADSGHAWAEIYQQHNSGTYNNQWIVLDLKRFVPFTAVQSGTLTILEQIPGTIEFSDQSKTLEKGYWPSYNVPFYEKIFNLSGYAAMAKSQPIMLSYDTCCRANIFRRDQGNVHDGDTFNKILRYNNWRHDPYSQGNPGYSISSRFDLEPDAEDAQAFGGYDNKWTSFEMAKRMMWKGLNGPTDVMQPSFEWTERGNMFRNVSHVGLPLRYAFGFVDMKPQQF